MSLMSVPKTWGRTPAAYSLELDAGFLDFGRDVSGDFYTSARKVSIIATLTK